MMSAAHRAKTPKHACYGNPDDIMEQAKRDAATKPGVEVVVRLGENEVFKVTYIKSKDHFECARCVSGAGGKSI